MTFGGWSGVGSYVHLEDSRVLCLMSIRRVVGKSCPLDGGWEVMSFGGWLGLWSHVIRRVFRK